MEVTIEEGTKIKEEVAEEGYARWVLRASTFVGITRKKGERQESIN